MKLSTQIVQLAVVALLLVCAMCNASRVPKRQVEETDLQTLVMQQAETIGQLKSELTGMKSQIAALEQRLSTQETAVAFNARLTDGDGHNINRDDVIILRNVDLNDGNAYNNVSGVFTAPVSGIYQFHIHVTHTPPGGLHVQIMKNDHQTLAEVQTSGDNDKDRASNSVEVHLKEGDRIWLRRLDRTSADIEGWWRTSFGGVLIVPDRAG